MKHFKAYELVDHSTFDRMGETALDLFVPAALQALDDLREYFGAPITVNNWHAGGLLEWRGYRTLAKAAELGAPKSKHALGEAFDCDIAGMLAEDARKQIILDQDNELLKRIMRMEARVNWLHFDVAELPYGVQRIYMFHANK
jgi:hypothetical protein